MNKITETVIEADPKLPVIRMARDFAATPEQLLRAHTDPALFARWVGPDAMTTRIEHWDAQTGGSWRYASVHDGTEYWFHGCFHDVRPDRIVQTFTFEGDPDGVALETLWFEDLGEGRTRLRTQSVDENPVAAWQVHCDGVQAVLDDPETARRELANPHIGRLPLATAIDQFYTADVFMHTWDLARATGQDDRLDPDFCAQLLGGMEQMEQVIRASGQYGPRVEVPGNADTQTRLLGFIGRDPF